MVLGLVMGMGVASSRRSHIIVYHYVSDIMVLGLVMGMGVASSRRSHIIVYL